MNKLYENIRTKLITPDGGTENFEVTSGVLQGDTLAPCIFARPHFVPNINKNQSWDFNWKGPGKNFQDPAIIIKDLDFADNVALLIEEIEQQTQGVLRRLENKAEKVGLYFNTKKTEM